MFFVFPMFVDVPMRRLPWMNWVLIAVTILFFPLCGYAGHFTPLGKSMILGTGEFGLFGHVLVHADIFHLLGNMLFLWVFGNAVCAKVGNLAYPLIYFGLGAVSSLDYLIRPLPSLGASGAIFGIVGIFTVWYLLNNISIWYAGYGLGKHGTGTIEISSGWMILLWILQNIWGQIRATGNVNFLAHLIGFAAGFALAVILLQTGWIKMGRGERSLLQVFAEK